MMLNVFVNGQSVMVNKIVFDVEEVEGEPYNGYKTFTPGKHSYKLYGIDDELILETEKKPVITYAWDLV